MTDRRPSECRNRCSPIRPGRRHRVRTAASCLLALLLIGCSGEGWLDGVGAEGGSSPPVDDGAGTLRLGDQVRAGGDLTTAAALYRRASRESPADPEPLLRLGETEFALGNLARAEGAFRAALVVRPGDQQATVGLGRVLVARGLPQEALSVLDSLPPAAPGVHGLDADIARGVALDMLGRHDEAQGVYQQGLAAAPRDLRLRSNLGLSLALAGKEQEAVPILEQVAADPLADTRHRRNLALILAATGDEAGARAEVAGLLKPDQVESLIGLGRTIGNGGADLDPSQRLGVLIVP
jgi:Flp pilus assembly protein TadD